MGVDRSAPVAPGPRNGFEGEREGGGTHLSAVLEPRERTPFPGKHRQRGTCPPVPPPCVRDRIFAYVRPGPVDPVRVGGHLRARRRKDRLAARADPSTFLSRPGGAAPGGGHPLRGTGRVSPRLLRLRDR